MSVGGALLGGMGMGLALRATDSGSNDGEAALAGPAAATGAPDLLGEAVVLPSSVS